MTRKNYLLFIFLLSASLIASAQTCPGPSVRTALINLQKSGTTIGGITSNGARAGQVGITDTCGNQRYQYYVRVLDTCVNYNPILTVGNLPLSSFVFQCGSQDSLFYIDWKGDAVLVSVANDTAALYNWYTRNDTTTDLGRTAWILRSAYWRGLDTLGIIRHTMRPDLFNGTESTLYQDSLVLEYTNATVIRNYFTLADTGIIISTTGDEPRSVNMRTDTVNWSSSFDPTLQRHNLLADGTYFYADSLKVVGIGQFPAFPSLAGDGTDKGFMYDPSNEGILMQNGSGIDGAFSKFLLTSTSFGAETVLNATDGHRVFFSGEDASFALIVENPTNTYESVRLDVSNINQVSLVSMQNRGINVDTNRTSYLYLGESNNFLSGYNGRRAFGVRTFIPEELEPNAETFDWAQIFLPNDTTENALSFYNRAYYWKNEHPIGATNTDTLIHFWAATGPGNEAGKDPGFMTLNQIRDGVTNWYNSNGTTTDNTRIATVTETATWLSDDVAADGVYPFRFELAGNSPNEPENMVWVFPAGDSATLSQSDQELVFFSSNQWVFQSDEKMSLWADSLAYLNQGVLAFSIAKYNTISQGGAADGGKSDLIENRTITGVSQSELFLDGSSVPYILRSNSNVNFEIHISAICSSPGNGIGISAGDSYDSWHLGGIKRISNTTSIVGSVQSGATAQADASMSDAVVTIDADDTDESLRIRFTPPSAAGTTTVIKVIATINATINAY